MVKMLTEADHHHSLQEGAGDLVTEVATCSPLPRMGDYTRAADIPASMKGLLKALATMSPVNMPLRCFAND